MENAYPFTKSHNTLNFIHFRKLAKLINESYEKVYTRNIQDLKLQTIFELEMKLRAFHSTLPDPLRPEKAASSSSCLLPHIFCLNILLHTMLILIFRPFFGWSRHSKLQDHALALRAQKVCIEEANKVNEFFRQYGHAFNFQNQTYLVSYCVYTAATIDIQQIQHEDPVLATAAATRLSTTLKMLESEARQTPGIRRSIEIIKSHLKQLTEQITAYLPKSKNGPHIFRAPSADFISRVFFTPHMSHIWHPLLHKSVPPGLSWCEFFWFPRNQRGVVAPYSRSRPLLVEEHPEFVRSEDKSQVFSVGGAVECTLTHNLYESH